MWPAERLSPVGLAWWADALFWSAATIGAYLLGRRVHDRWPSDLTSPLLLAPLMLLCLALGLHEQYHDYLRATHWLVWMLGPVMVAFAIPIYERRRLVRRHWPALAVGVAVGSVIAVVTAWVLAGTLGLSPSLRLSLLSRSISTPFAMTVSQDIGGVPEITALFVILTGLTGASLGQMLLKWLPLNSSAARGALFGMGAHGVGVAAANQIGRDEGSIAGLVMIFAGLANVLLAPIIMYALRIHG